jgi:lambda family phage tail tape measure protein
MASNISVAITVDNKQYIANINAADNATKKFATDTEKNLGKVGGSFDVLSKRVLGLRGVLAGLAFGAVGKSALQMADQLQDLSNSTGIAVSTLLEFRNALAVTGGEADQMPTAINKLLQSVDEAANGSIKAQNSFAKLGINLQELGSLSEQDLLAETLKGIAALPSKTEQAAAMMDKFGKSFKMVDPQELLDKLTATAGSGERYAASIKRAAELNDQLTTAQNNLKLAFLEAFSPAISALSELSNNIGNTTSSMSGLITTVKVLGLALAVALGAEVGIYLTRMIGHLLRATQAMGLFAKASFGATSVLMNGIRGVMVSFGIIGIAILAASLLFDNFGKEVKQVMLFVGEYALKAAALLGSAFSRAFMIPIMAINALSKALGLGIKIPEDLGEPLRKLAEDARMARRELDVFSGRSSAEFAATDERRSDIGSINARKAAGTGTGSRPIDTTATQNALTSIKDMTAEYQKQQAAIQSKIAFETQFIGLSENEKQLAEAQRKLAEDYLDLQDKLIKKRESLTKEEREQGVLGKEINNQINLAAQGFTAQFNALTKVVQGQQTAKQLEEDRLYFIDLQTKSMNTILDIEMQIANFSRGEDDRKLVALQRQIKLEEDAAVKREQGRLGATPLGAEAEAAVREKVRKSMEGQLDAQVKLNAASKAESARLFVQDLQNTAIANTISLQAELAKLTMTSDQQRIKDLQTQNELLVRQEIAKRNALLKPGESITAAEIAQITAQVTAANQGFITSTQAIIDKSREFSTGFEQAFIKYKDDAENAATQSKTYFETFTKGFEDSIVKFVQTGKLSFKDLANSLIADFVRIQAKQLMLGLFGGGGGGGFLGGIGKIFGFANGGMPPVGVPSIVGERGPELFVPQSAGRIIPNNALGGGGQSQVINNAVSYNISAVDAQSFKSLLARDPEFIHNVAEQGRRQLPIRSRR